MIGSSKIGPKSWLEEANEKLSYAKLTTLAYKEFKMIKRVAASSIRSFALLRTGLVALAFVIPSNVVRAESDLMIDWSSPFIAYDQPEVIATFVLLPLDQPSKSNKEKLRSCSREVTVEFFALPNLITPVAQTDPTVLKPGDVLTLSYEVTSNQEPLIAKVTQISIDAFGISICQSPDSRAFMAKVSSESAGTYSDIPG